MRGPLAPYRSLSATYAVYTLQAYTPKYLAIFAFSGIFTV